MPQRPSRPGPPSEGEAPPRIPSAVTPRKKHGLASSRPSPRPRASAEPGSIRSQSGGGGPPISPRVIPHAAQRRCGIGEPGASRGHSRTNPQPPCLPDPGSSACGLVREDAKERHVRQERRRRHTGANPTRRMSSRFRRSRRPGPSNHGSGRFKPRRCQAGSSCLRTPTRPGGYWTPACAGVTAEEVAVRPASRLLRAPMAPGSPASPAAGMTS